MLRKESGRPDSAQVLWYYQMHPYIYGHQIPVTTGYEKDPKSLKASNRTGSSCPPNLSSCSHPNPVSTQGFLKALTTVSNQYFTMKNRWYREVWYKLGELLGISNRSHSSINQRNIHLVPQIALLFKRFFPSNKFNIENILNQCSTGFTMEWEKEITHRIFQIHALRFFKIFLQSLQPVFTIQVNLGGNRF